MQILIYGSGVIGTIFGAKLAQAGHDVTMLARGNRLAEIDRMGLVLRHSNNGREEHVTVKTISKLEPDRVFDFIFVVMQRTQVDDVLPVLAKNRTQNIVFVVNNASGYQSWIDAIGIKRLLIGFPSAGGERVNGAVNYFIGKGVMRSFQTTTFGEASGERSERISTLIRIFNKAGIPSVFCANMDAWQKTHVAMVTAIANALYGHRCDNKSLARSYADISLMVDSVKEGFAALRALGIRPTPSKLCFWDLPRPILVRLFQVVMYTKIAETTMAKHCLTAKSEMIYLQEELDHLIRKSGIQTFAINRLRENLFR